MDTDVVSSPDFTHVPDTQEEKEEKQERKATIADVRRLLGEDDLLQCFGAASDRSLSVFQPNLQYLKVVEREIRKRLRDHPFKREEVLRQLKGSS